MRPHPAFVSLAAVVATLAVSAATTPATPPARPALTQRTAEDAAKLRALGNLDVRAHDPSTIVRCKDEYWMFYTSVGVRSWRSKDLKTWVQGPPVFTERPGWVPELVPEHRDGRFWAPDVIKAGDRYLLYYSVSSFGKNTSAIALASNATLDPADPAFKWHEEGVVVRSVASDKFNAIDPALTFDAEGRLWMAFGSFWSGIKLIELDAKTGKRIAPDSPMHALAYKREIEAAFIYRHGRHYYLFINHDVCCRGTNSTYKIRVGRSDAITGPYLDRAGKSLLEGGGTPVLETDGPFIGPGHAGIIAVNDREWLSCHFYDGTQGGRPTVALRPLAWDSDGWPVVGTTADAN